MMKVDKCRRRSSGLAPDASGGILQKTIMSQEWSAWDLNERNYAKSSKGFLLSTSRGERTLLNHGKVETLMDSMTWYDSLAKPSRTPSPAAIGLIWAFLPQQSSDRFLVPSDDADQEG